jgi:hypothetical protein
MSRVVEAVELGSCLVAWCAVLQPLAACSSNDPPGDRVVMTFLDGSTASDSGMSVDGRLVPEAGAIANGDADIADAGSTALPDAETPPCSGDLPVMQAFDPEAGAFVDPDWSCYAGTATSAHDADAGAAPSEAGVDKSAILQLTYAPGNSVPFPGGTVDFFFGHSTLGKPALTGVTDADAGTIRFTAPAGEELVSVWVHATKNPTSPVTDIVDVHEFDLPIVRSPAVIGASALVSLPVDALLANVLGAAELGDRRKAILGAVVRDCRGRDVGGAQLELIDTETNAPVAQGTGAGEPRAVYGRFALPDVSCTYTSAERSEWMMVNAPTNVSNGAVTHAYRLRAKGRMHASDSQLVILGEPAVELFSGGFSSVRPYRISPP